MRVRVEAVEGKTPEDKASLRLMVEMEDTGPGIPDTDMERIFDPFQQTATGVKAGGTGLGLAISRKFVEMMGGELTVTSQIGAGSCFRFEVLMAQAGDIVEQEKPALRCVIGLEPGTGPFRILVVDDIPDNRALLCDELKNHFLGMAAHDLRTPLCGIMGMSELLANQLSPLPAEKQSRFFEMLLASSRFMAGIVNDLLDVSAIESGHLTINRRMVDITVPIKQSVEINEMFASPQNISIGINCQEQLPLVLADTNRIEQVINNLLSNAIKYSQPGTNITVHLRHENNEVIISVADQGPGIPEKEQHKLFHAFGKTSVQPASKEDRSTGLGLLIVKKIMEAHEGRLWLLSEPGKGTEFFFSLPVMP